MFRGKKKQKEKRIRTLAEDLLKGVAHGGSLDRTWDPKGLVRKDETLLEQGHALELLQTEGHIERAKGGWKLTQSGHDRALELVRAHRLVETYLARQEGLAAGELHRTAEEVEHIYSAEGINALADALNRPRFDPHGDPIPERAEDLHDLDQIHLLDMESGDTGRIAHIEDEPREDFEALINMGLAVELPMRVVSRDKKQLIIELAGEEVPLTTRLASHVEIIPVREPGWYPEDLRRLSALSNGESGTVAFISAACVGPERRRLMDFGLVPGSPVRREFSSPFGSPVAYSLRGTTIGLREEQARNIFIRIAP